MLRPSKANNQKESNTSFKRDDCIDDEPSEEEKRKQKIVNKVIIYVIGTSYLLWVTYKFVVVPYVLPLIQ